MSTHHRYLVADGGSTSLDELRRCLHECGPSYDLDEDTVTFDGMECGLILDVTERGDPIFDDDIDLVTRRANDHPSRGEILPGLSGAKCMVTMQVASHCDETALDALFEWLRVHKKGILAYEDGSFRVDK